eukprot:Skav210396  [mRNA]  locus=scaffold1416:53729:55594:+ [translate_table: standard]
MRRQGAATLICTISFASGHVGLEPFCSHKFPWQQCKEHLPAEKEALESFLKELALSPKPSPSAFKGRGIVMSGGAKHVLQALSNLDILRDHHKSDLPVEFWHSFELEDAHCDALAARGALCRQLQVPGVYKEYATIVPAVMSSSFQHVLWMDTDVTPLMAPEALFETQAYQLNGALFWPDHWSQDCYPFGESSWPNHVALQVLELKHNSSDPHFSQEHETGHFLINKVTHWDAICLANYLATRHFFTRVLVGCKDAFRLAFLKLNVSHWLSSERPGLVGTGFTGMFFPAAMVQFWPLGQKLAGSPPGRPQARPVPLYIHQKKLPGMLWNDFLTFQQPLGHCTRFKLENLDIASHNDTVLWNLEETDPELWEHIVRIETLWEESFARNLERLTNHPGLSEASKRRLTFEMDPFHSKQWDLSTISTCRCDFGNNLWLHILTFLIPGQREMVFNTGNCGLILSPDFDASSCPIGFATLALLCHQLLEGANKKQARQVALDLRPALETCLPKTFWPLKLEHFDATHSPPLAFNPDVVSHLAEPLRRCLPLKLPECWHPNNAFTDRWTLLKDTNLGVKNACIYCCGTGNSSDCFDAVYSEELCCNQLIAQGKSSKQLVSHIKQKHR